MRNKIFELGVLAAIMGAPAQRMSQVAPMPKRKCPRRVKSSANKSYVGPRSMTAEEKVYYDRNKSLAGFYK